MKIALLHTAQVHVDTFDDIFGQISPDVRLEHVVRPDLLERCALFGPDAVRSEVTETLLGLGRADAVMCTCSTLGPLVDEAARSASHIVRIDRPLMEQACRDGQRILVALCLESTRQATVDLVEDCAAGLGLEVDLNIVVCRDAWAFFEAGDMTAYAASIAKTITAAMSRAAPVDSIVLAQASMRVAHDDLRGLEVPIRSSPVLAVQRCVQVAQQNSTKDADIGQPVLHS